MECKLPETTDTKADACELKCDAVPTPKGDEAPPSTDAKPEFVLKPTEDPEACCIKPMECGMACPPKYSGDGQ